MYHDTFRVSVVLWFLLSVLSHAQQPQIQPDANLSYLKNKAVCVGVDLNRGGVIAWLSGASRPENLVNVNDLGRYIQQSYYAFPEPFGNSHHPNWKGWPWNPLCAGDAYKNVSRVLTHTNDRRAIYVRTAPKQWALNNVDAECIMEQWIELQGNAVLVRNRLTNHRSDKRLYEARTFEAPCAQIIRALNHIYTYTGAHPFENDRLTKITKVAEGSGNIPWDKWYATENWSAAVNDNNWGLGVFHSGVFDILGGFYLPGMTGGPLENPISYIAPLQQEVLDHNIVYEYTYVLVVGTLQQIRQYVYDHRPNTMPDYHFTSDRQHWWYHNAGDTGMPIRGELHVNLEGVDSELIGPLSWWNARQVPKLYIEAAFHTKRHDARLYWRTPEKHDFNQTNSLKFKVNNDGDYHVYDVDLEKSPAYRGPITGIRFDPGSTSSHGEYVQVRYITHIKPSQPESTKSVVANLPTAPPTSKSQNEQLTGKVPTHSGLVRQIRFTSDKSLDQFVLLNKEDGKWTIDDGKLIVAETKHAERPLTVYKEYFTSISSVTIRAGIALPTEHDLRVSVGPINMILNWGGKDKDQNHFRVGQRPAKATPTTPYALIPGRIHEIQVKQVGNQALVLIDGKQHNSAQTTLEGTVAIYPYFSKIMIQEIVIEGKPDPGKQVAEPSHDNIY